MVMSKLILAIAECHPCKDAPAMKRSSSTVVVSSHKTRNQTEWCSQAWKYCNMPSSIKNNNFVARVFRRLLPRPTRHKCSAPFSNRHDVNQYVNAVPMISCRNKLCRGFQSWKLQNCLRMLSNTTYFCVRRRQKTSPAMISSKRWHVFIYEHDDV